MTKFKLGAVLGFGVGWAVGSGRAADLWNQLQTSVARREPVPTGAAETNGFIGSGTIASEAGPRNVASV